VLELVDTQRLQSWHDGDGANAAAWCKKASLPVLEHAPNTTRALSDFFPIRSPISLVLWRLMHFAGGVDWCNDDLVIAMLLAGLLLLSHSDWTAQPTILGFVAW